MTRGVSLPREDSSLGALGFGVHDDDLRRERQLGARGGERVAERAYLFFCDQAMNSPDVDSSADISH